MVMKVFLFAIFQIFAPAEIISLESDNPTVKTSMGVVHGHYIKSYGGRTVSAFEGVPYAKPPTGELRFKEPQQAEPWNNVLQANTTYVCLQFTPIVMTSGIMGTEDCLYLYIYVPKEIITGSENMNVVVHIHGGAFMLGAPMYLAGPDYITDKDLVYVSFNYRVGIMGFLSTEDEIVPGNNGLKDQVMALKWIQENIQYFGGNPNSVTITGLSAGGASVHYHYLSPLSKGLFHRGFSQSGTALNMWALTENPLQNTIKLAGLLNCTTETTTEMTDCLRKQTDVNIIKALKNFFIFINAVPFTPFGPVIEKGNGAFLPEHPYKLLMEGKVHDYPWVTSNTRNEGIYPVGFFILYGKLGELDQNWDLIIPSALDYNNTVKDENKIAITHKIKDCYLNNQKLSMENINKLIDLFTDRLFLYDGETAIRLQSKAMKSHVYYYFYEYKMKTSTVFSKWLNGPAHSDDGRLLFKIIGNGKELPDEDEKMKDVLIDFVYNFATTGIPETNGVKWVPVGKGPDIKYTHVISPANISIESIEELAPTRFWKDLNLNENEHLFIHTQ